MNTKAQKAIDNAQELIDTSLDTAETGLQQVREAAPIHLARVAHRAEDLARAGIDKARAAGAAVADRAHRLGDSTTDYVREKPATALLMAAAAGAATTVLVGWALRRRAH